MAFLVHKNLLNRGFNILKESKGKHHIAITLGQGQNITAKLINVYLPVRNGKNLAKYKNALKDLETQITKNTLLLGDFNGWLQEHNYLRSNDHGMQLQDFITRTGLQVADNPPGPCQYTRSQGNSSTTLDYIMSKSVAISNLSISEDLDGTDHRLVSAEITFNGKPKRKNTSYVPVYKLRDDADKRHEYKNALETSYKKWQEKLQLINKHKVDVEASNEHFQKHILKICSNVLGRKI